MGISEINQKEKLYMAVMFIVLSTILWWMSANVPELQVVADYYFDGLQFATLGFIIAKIAPEYVSFTIWDNDSWGLDSQIILGSILTILIFLIPSIPSGTTGSWMTIDMGIPFATIPKEYLSMSISSIHIKIFRGLMGIIEDLVWYGVVGSTIGKWALFLVLGPVVMQSEGIGLSEFLRAPTSYLKSYKVKEPAVYALGVLIITAPIAGVIGNWVRISHTQSYTKICEARGISPCVLPFERVEKYGIIGETTILLTGSILPLHIVHFLNNFMSS